MKKIFFTLLLIIGISATGFSQNEKVKEKAQEKVEQLNAEITAGDASLALSDDQRQQILEIHVQRIMETKKMRKDDADKDDIKEVNKKYMKQIYDDLLSKEQKKARRAAKK